MSRPDSAAVDSGGDGASADAAGDGPSSASCSSTDWSGCRNVPGHPIVSVTISSLAQLQSYSGAIFQCNTSLLDYAPAGAVVTGSTYPVEWDLTYTGYFQAAVNQFSLSSGCTGDGDRTTIDLVLGGPQGNGIDRGDSGDGFRVGHGCCGPSGVGIQVTGSINCGPRPQGGNHLDAIQLLSGSYVDFYGITSGDFDGSSHPYPFATCQGAGGALFMSANQPNPPPTHITATGLRMMTCNAGVNFAYANDYQAIGAITDSIFRGVNAAQAADENDPSSPYYLDPTLYDQCGGGNLPGPGALVDNAPCTGKTINGVSYPPDTSWKYRGVVADPATAGALTAPFYASPVTTSCN